MKYSYLGFGIIMAGLFGIVFLVMFESITVDNESEYYVLKEAMEAAMLESIDISCFRSDETEGCGGTVKISEQKFVENFTRRFASSISGDVKEYEIQFYDIIESPPKATVVIKGLTGEYTIISDDQGIGITNALSGILEHNLFSQGKNDDEIINSGYDTSLNLSDSTSWTPATENKVYSGEVEIQEICPDNDVTCRDDGTVSEDTGEFIEMSDDISSDSDTEVNKQENNFSDSGNSSSENDNSSIGTNDDSLDNEDSG